MDADLTESLSARVRAAADDGTPPAIAGGGAQRWLRTDASADTPPSSAAVLKLHERIKAAFDPAGILNPGRMYEGI